MRETETNAKPSLKLQAYQYLKTKILNCEYAPSQFLNEQKLCAEMGNISRTPMRDALGRLEQEGLITILPKKGLMVSPITDEDVHSIYEVRLLVEPYALRVYGSQLPRDQLEKFVLLMQHPEMMPDFCAADDAFHELLISPLPNRYLRSAHDSITGQNTRLFRLLLFRAGRGNSVRKIGGDIGLHRVRFDGHDANVFRNRIEHARKLLSPHDVFGAQPRRQKSRFRAGR